MNNWLIFGLLSLFFWGVWGLFAKLAANYINPKSILVFETIGILLVVCFILISLNFKPEINSRGMIFAALGGLMSMVGTLFFFYALSKGKISITVTMTALYPLVTILLSFLILKETINLKQGIGIILALGAMVLFAK